jgi:trigger factor
MTIQIVEKSGEGLSRVFGVTIPAADLAQKLDAKITEIRPQMNLKGFRPGKVPVAHVKRLYGKSLMGEIIEQTVTEGQAQALSTSKVRAAGNPDIKVESDIEKVLAGASDLAFELAVEVMPDFEPVDIAAIALTRPVYLPTDEDVDAQLDEIAGQNRTYEAKDAAAEDGDMVVADFVGRLDGEVFEGGSGEDAEIVLGANRFIPGFEAQLIGAKAGETVTVKVTFPEDYGATQLAGKPAEFEVTVKEIKAPAEGVADEAFATRIGFDSLDSLKTAIRNQLGQQYAGASRYKAKRALLDVLDAKHDFPLPPRMVEAEFDVIWRQVEAERDAGELSVEDQGKSDEQLRSEYRKIAERRVRLGLVLAEIGQRANVQVTDQEMNGALAAEARRYPGQEREIYDFFRKNPQAAAQLRAPIYEEKVVDLILSNAQVTDLPTSKEALFAEDEMPEGYGDASAATTEAATPEPATPESATPESAPAAEPEAVEAAPEPEAPQPKPKKPRASKAKTAEAEPAAAAETDDA